MRVDPALGELLADTGARRDEWGMGLIWTVFNLDRPSGLELSGLRTEPVELAEQSATFDAAASRRRHSSSLMQGDECMGDRFTI